MDAQLLEGLADGASTDELASRLYLSRQGIEYRVRAMFRRFGASNRTQLVAKAYSRGVLAERDWPPKVAPDYVE
ncbi:response regulator transcription factor [Streptomyces sp. NBC_00878]|uniref:response regulator transcription factor n=1 Tax=Streptomyces sp. NBC_00878 TaxID=2975854 RepID=UPI002253DCD7|nr:helix-turn-helix transcriptional regulator [Streptomyces sp. NBC_00878]MCX4909692.1 helix-turn-helix transcriptional regulator [Streptomyces sp. NBC_00878]